jgi:hypothetical protein
VSCATARPPAPEVVAQARAVATYNGRVKVRLDGRELRGRATVLLAFQRPDSLRVELPGPGGLRLLAVTRGGRVTAVFPAERAVFEGSADAPSMDALLGVALTPAEVMDLLLGAVPSRLPRAEFRWGPRLPRSVEAWLPDGSRVRMTIEEGEAGAALPPAAFDPPSADGHRRVDVEEARRLWSR